MSFEIDMDKLEDPPAKSDQEAITSFWGTYAWPYQTYNRFTQLEGLEQMADETRSMAKALRYITQASELGLSIDGGLGFLSGPDINSLVAARAKKLVVFGDSKFVAATPARKQPKEKAKTDAAADRTGIFSNLERMLRDAGYSGERLETAQLMIASGRAGDLRAAEQLQQAGQPVPSRFSLGQVPQMVENAFNNWRGRSPRVTENDSTDGIADLLDSLGTSSDDESGGVPVTETAVQTRYQALPKPKEKDAMTLRPNALTTPQKEMLLEMEWAQSAFMQSWVIAIIDNASTFVNVRKLTVARLPKRHLNILSRKDLWDSLPHLQALSLAIIPDWREIQKDETAWVQECSVIPSASITSVFQLLTDQIAHRKNITSLHFEWLCGGEYAPGLFSRNQLLLPAPVVSNASQMVNRAMDHAVLNLPYVKHLSLKNCWFTPHILNKFLWLLKKDSLETVSFNSVSLTAHVTPGASPISLTLGTAANNAHNVQNAIQAGANLALIGLQAPPNPLAPAQPQTQQLPIGIQQNGPTWLQHQRVGSWVDVIEHLTPGKTLAEFRYDQDLESEPEPRNLQKLRKLSFTSCGYIRLPMDLDQTVLGTEDLSTTAPTSNIMKRINDIDSCMMKANDHYFGVISNHIPESEVAALENAWGFNVGWRQTRPEFAEWAELAEDARLDGALNAGKGRFQGVIEVAAGSSMSRV